MIRKNGVVGIAAYDATPAYAYTIGLFANHALPEIMMMFPAIAPSDQLNAVLSLLSVADYLATLPTADEGTYIPANVSGVGVDLWLWSEDVNATPARSGMGIARDYYRELHMRRLENVPVFIVSPKPHPRPRPERSEPYVPPRVGGIVARMLAEARAAVGDAT